MELAINYKNKVYLPDFSPDFGFGGAILHERNTVKGS